MSKVKQGLFSLKAQGTVAGVLTYQKSSGVEIARGKPALPYFLTLPVQYQRWLYEDYVALWHQQTPATKATYRQAGVRHHLTAFQYWIKYQLSNLPDILGMWYLDRRFDAVAPDYSRNDNPATVFGASYVPSRIQDGLYFDGINDYCLITNHPSLDVTPANWSIQFWINQPVLGASAYFGFNNAAFTKGWYLGMDGGRRLQMVTMGAGGNDSGFSSADPFPASTNSLITINVNPPNIWIYSGTTDVTLLGQVSRDVDPAPDDYYFNRTNQVIFWEGTLDQIILRSRCLTLSDIERHSLRGWSSQ